MNFIDVSNGYCHCIPQQTTLVMSSLHLSRKAIASSKRLAPPRFWAFFVGLFKVLRVGNCFIPSSKSLLHHFFRKTKNPWKSSTWRWTDESDAILPQLLWQLGILTGMTPAGPNSIHLQNGGNVWAETAGCTEIIWNLNLPWHFEFCTWSRCGLRSHLLLFRDAANQIHVGIVVDVLTTWAIFLNVLCAPAPFVSMFFQLLHFLREFINLNQRLQCYKMLL